MNHTPIILLVGQAGSGKDTVAGFMVKNHNAISIAQADPMKRLSKILFGFTEEQLWGPSDCRNAVDPRFLGDGANERWFQAYLKVNESEAVGKWIEEVLPGSTGIRATLADWVSLMQSQTFWQGKPLTPRFVLQTLGTEWGRKQSRDMWTDAAVKTAYKLLSGGYGYDRAIGLVQIPSTPGPDYVVISDGRFRNEIVNVLMAGGQVIRIDSPNADGLAAETAGVKGHQSETEQRGVPVHFFTAFIWNDKAKGLTDCEINVSWLMRTIGGNGNYHTVGRDGDWTRAH